MSFHSRGPITLNDLFANDSLFAMGISSFKYAHENGCPWNDFTSFEVARNGLLECLKYAHKNGCPWDEDTCVISDRNGHLECLKYAHDNGCP